MPPSPGTASIPQGVDMLRSVFCTLLTDTSQGCNEFTPLVVSLLYGIWKFSGEMV